MPLTSASLVSGGVVSGTILASNEEHNYTFTANAGQSIVLRAGRTGGDRITGSVKSTYDTIKQQLPPVETIDGFVSANQMAIAQLAIQYCDALVESTGLNTGLRDTFFGTTPSAFGFTSDVDTAFAGGGKDQIVDALYDNVVAYRALGGTETLAEKLWNYT